MKKLAVLGRILFALPFAIMGLNHFLMTDVLVGMMTSFIPGGGFTILVTGAMLIIASLCIMLNKYARIASYWIAGMLFLFIVTIHIPHLFTYNRQIAMIDLVKDVGLMGGAIILAIYLKPEEDNKTEQ